MRRLTKAQTKLMRRYTSACMVFDEYAVKLTVGSQSFTLRTYCTSKKAAEWHRRMLAVALENLINTEAWKR